MRYSTLVFLILCALSTGCATKHGRGTFVGDLPEGAATEHMAEDSANYLASEYAPGHTTLAVQAPDPENLDAFSNALDGKLRTKGFSLVSAPEADALTLNYTLDKIREEKGEPDSWYVQMRIRDHQGLRAIARCYNEHGQPMGGHSSIMLTEEESFVSKATKKANQSVTKFRGAFDE